MRRLLSKLMRRLSSKSKQRLSSSHRNVKRAVVQQRIGSKKPRNKPKFQQRKNSRKVQNPPTRKMTSKMMSLRRRSMRLSKPGILLKYRLKSVRSVSGLSRGVKSGKIAGTKSKLAVIVARMSAKSQRRSLKSKTMMSRCWTQWPTSGWSKMKRFARCKRRRPQSRKRFARRKHRRPTRNGWKKNESGRKKIAFAS